MRLGIENLLLRSSRLLQKRRVGLLSHQAALLSNGATSAQRLYHLRGVDLVALYGPEHGFFGQALAGEQTASRPHPDWKIPVYSLYGEFRKPTPAMLQGIDVMVCDLQDLGVRCYTYLATLRNVLEACAEANIPVIVTDRPIPLPEVVDGPMLDPAFASFVAPCPLPMVYGMTPGEVALWLAKKFELDLDLTVIPMEGWQRSEAAWGPAYPDWVPPSPGIKSWETAMTYAATVFSEALPTIDCGRGTNLAFRVIGAPWFKAEETCQVLTALKLPGVTFNPYRYVAGTPPYQGLELDGVRLCVTYPATFKPARTSVMLLATLASLYGKKRVWNQEGVRPEWFDKLYGTDTPRRALQSGEVSGLFQSWAKASQGFRRERQQVLLYH